MLTRGFVFRCNTNQATNNSKLPLHVVAEVLLVVLRLGKSYTHLLLVLPYPLVVCFNLGYTNHIRVNYSLAALCCCCVAEEGCIACDDFASCCENC